MKTYYKSRDSLSAPLLSNPDHKQPVSDISLSIIHIDKRSQNPPSKPPHPGDERSERLEAHRRRFNTNNAVAIENIFDEDSQAKKKPRHLLITGDAGMGKSTMIQYMAYKWANNQLWVGRFEYIFWIPLRNLHKRCQDTEISLARIICVECLKGKIDEENRVNVTSSINKILKDEKEAVLFLLDGYDELSHLNKPESPVNELFQRIFEYSVILTSRPYCLSDLPRFDVELENIGFNDYQVTSYVNNYFSALEPPQPARPKELLTFIETENNVRGVVHVPLNLALMCGLWQEFAESGNNLEKDMTITILYQKINERLMKRYLRRSLIKARNTVGWISPKLEEQCRPELMTLEYLAFKAFQTARRVQVGPELFNSAFIRESDEEYCKSVDKKDASIVIALSEVGLLKNLSSPHHDPAENYSEFIHLTFQEYFAARYVIRSLQEHNSGEYYQEAVNFIKNKKYDTSCVVIFQFIAGLLNDGIQTPVFWKLICNGPRDLLGLQHACIIVTCLRERGDRSDVPYMDEELDKVTLWCERTIDADTMRFCDSLFRSVSASNDKLAKLTIRLIGHLSQVNTQPDFTNQTIHAFREMAKSRNNIRYLIDATRSRLKHEDPEVSSRMINILPGIFPHDAEGLIDVIMDILKNNHKHNSVEMYSANSLRQFFRHSSNLDPIAEKLSTQLGNNDPNVRYAAVIGLREIGHLTPKFKHVIHKLLAMVHDDALDVRLTAIASIRELHKDYYVADDSILETLLSLLRDPRDEVRSETCKTIKVLGNSFGKIGRIVDGIKFLLVVGVDSSVLAAAISVLSEIGHLYSRRDQLMQTLSAMKDHSDENVRFQVIWTLAKIWRSGPNSDPSADTSESVLKDRSAEILGSMLTDVSIAVASCAHKELVLMDRPADVIHELIKIRAYLNALDPTPDFYRLHNNVLYGVSRRSEVCNSYILSQSLIVQSLGLMNKESKHIDTVINLLLAIFRDYGNFDVGEIFTSLEKWGISLSNIQEILCLVEKKLYHIDNHILGLYNLLSDEAIEGVNLNNQIISIQRSRLNIFAILQRIRSMVIDVKVAKTADRLILLVLKSTKDYDTFLSIIERLESIDFQCIGFDWDEIAKIITSWAGPSDKSTKLRYITLLGKIQKRCLKNKRIIKALACLITDPSPDCGSAASEALVQIAVDPSNTKKVLDKFILLLSKECNIVSFDARVKFLALVEGRISQILDCCLRSKQLISRCLVPLAWTKGPLILDSTRGILRFQSIIPTLERSITMEQKGLLLQIFDLETY